MPKLKLPAPPIPKKLNPAPRRPGQELDGIGQYLYPSRPTQRKIPGT